MTNQSATNSRPTAKNIGFYGGRARFNVRRQAAAQQRRVRVAKLMTSASLHRLGWQTEIARQLGVHRSTICRDVRLIRKSWRQHRSAVVHDRESQREQFAAMVLASCGGEP